MHDCVSFVCNYADLRNFDLINNILHSLYKRIALLIQIKLIRVQLKFALAWKLIDSDSA